MTIVNFVVAMSVPRLLDRMPSIVVLGAGVAATFAGMIWLSRVDAADSFLTGVALPMVLIGLGQGLAFAPLTSYALTGISGADAGAASGLLNTAHQLGSSLGLAVLVAVGAAATRSGSDAVTVLSQRVEIALTGSAIMLALALVIVLVVVLPADLARRRAAAR
jgi:sugar phosphate permease